MANRRSMKRGRRGGGFMDYFSSTPTTSSPYGASGASSTGSFFGQAPSTYGAPQTDKKEGSGFFGNLFGSSEKPQELMVPGGYGSSYRDSSYGASQAPMAPGGYGSSYRAPSYGASQAPMAPGGYGSSYRASSYNAPRASTASSAYGGKKRRSKRMKGGRGLGLDYYATPVDGSDVAQPTYMMNYEGGRRRTRKHSSRKRCGKKCKKGYKKH